MKKFFAFIMILFWGCIYSTGANATIFKLLIEVKEDLEKLEITNLKSTEVHYLLPWKINPSIFLFECNSLVDNFLVSSKKCNFRLMQLNNQKLTSWFELGSDKSISFDEIFTKFNNENSGQEKTNVYDFIISNYLGNPIVMGNNNLRTKPDDGAFFYNTQSTFLCKDSMLISWHKSRYPVSIEISDIEGTKNIWQTDNYSDTCISYAFLAGKLITDFQFNKTYLCKISLSPAIDEVYFYNFVIVLPEKELNELKTFVEK